jgi:hypothetical protein
MPELLGTEFTNLIFIAILLLKVFEPGLAATLMRGNLFVWTSKSGRLIMLSLGENGGKPRPGLTPITLRLDRAARSLRLGPTT